MALGIVEESNQGLKKPTKDWFFCINQGYTVLNMNVGCNEDLYIEALDNKKEGMQCFETPRLVHIHTDFGAIMLGLSNIYVGLGLFSVLNSCLANFL